MPYISELLDNKIKDTTDTIVGKLSDILIQTPQIDKFEPLEFLKIKSSNDGEIYFIAFDQVANFTTSQITLKSQFAKIAQMQLPKKNYIGLKKDVLDKQIVDIAGTRVVRVNDLRIGIFDNKMCVLGIDESFSGLLRRLGVENQFLNKFLKVNLIDWRQAQLIDSAAPLQLNTATENLSHLHPADLANIVEDLDVLQGSSLLSALDHKEAAKVFEELDPQLQNIFVKYLGPEKAGKILSFLPVDEFVDLVKTFPHREAQKLISNIKNGRAKNLEKLLDYEDNTAGGLMTTETVTVRPEWDVKKNIDEVKKYSESLRSILYVYVTEEDGRFRGVISMRRLLLAKPEFLAIKISKALTPYAILKPHDRISKIIKIMTKYNLYTAVVLDKEKKLVGIVTIDDVMRYLYPAA